MKIYFLIKLKEIVKMLLPPKTNKIIKLLRLLFNAYTLDIFMDYFKITFEGFELFSNYFTYFKW